jgi:tRNA 5-methylaminomethyl-2-thiouridine biosynthesis bifunctional protein
VHPDLSPTTLEFDEHGRPYSQRYGDYYASRDGALGQARHVFLAGNHLPRRWSGRRQFVIVETGFGLGTNFLATWLAWRTDPRRPRRLHFVSIERHPLRADDLLAAAASTDAGADAAELQALRRQLAACWPLPLPGLHRIEFERGELVLTLALGDARRLVPQLPLGADAFYLDGFAPDRNPDMWDAGVIKGLSRLARTDATAATWSCARGVRDALVANGFSVETRPGFGSKREMIAARYAPRWKLRRHEPAAPLPEAAHAIVVGAGLAGCACADALRRRGWRVTVLESAPAVASGASGLPSGLLHPLLSADDNLVSRLTRAGFLFGLDRLRRLAPPGAVGDAQGLWSDCGVFQQAETAEEARAMASLLARHAWPAEFAVYRDARAAGHALGVAPRHGGTWFERGAVVSAARWCRAMIEAREDDPDGAFAPQLLLDCTVAGIRRVGGLWRVQTARGAPHEAPVLVLAQGLGLRPFAELGLPPLQAIGGRISLLRPPALARLRAGISGDGYVIPPLLGSAAVGATYETEAGPPPPGPMKAGAAPRVFAPADAAQDPTEHAHAANRARLHALLEGAPTVEIAGVFAGVRCVSPDRLPLAGAVVDPARAQEERERLRGAHLPDLPRLPGLYCLAALGSRGLSLAALLGEHVAAQIEGEPAPIETALAAAVDPGRFRLRGLR